jgi:hypothetical protein
MDGVTKTDPLLVGPVRLAIDNGDAGADNSGTGEPVIGQVSIAVLTGPWDKDVGMVLKRLLMGMSCAGLLVLGFGCSDDGGDSEVKPEGEGCAALLSDCIQAQKACVEAINDLPAHCELCPHGQSPNAANGQCAPIVGTVYEHAFEEVSMEAGEEFSGVCQSWVLNNETELWVNAVEFVSDGLYHHSNWFFVPEGKNNYKPGKWMNCYEEGFSELDAAIAGGVLFAQSTQVARDLQKFPDGVAVRIPPNSRVIAATHLLNTSPQTETTGLTMRIYTIDSAEVTVKLSPFRLTYGALDIPAGSTAEFTSNCDLDDLFQKLKGEPLNLKLYYALPHYHALGHGFRLGIHGGPQDGKTLFELGPFGADPFGRVFDPPVDLAGATGLSFTCGFRNPTDKAVGWGIGDQEMCVMLGFAESELAFDASVDENTVLGPDAENVVQNIGDCSVIGFGFSQLKEGGLPSSADSR